MWRDVNLQRDWILRREHIKPQIGFHTMASFPYDKGLQVIVIVSTKEIKTTMIPCMLFYSGAEQRTDY